MTSEKKEDFRFAGISAFIMGVFGILCFIIFFLWKYEYIIEVEIASGKGCGPIIVYFYPIFTDVGVIAGVLWIISALGFFNNQKWAFNVSVIANILSLKTSFWPNIPAMESGASLPLWLIIFVINLIMYFILLRRIGKFNWNKILFGLGMGMCFILCFINGIAATQRMVFLDKPERTIYIMTERMNFIASFGWGFSIFGLLMSNKEWIKWVAIGSSILGMIGGYLVAFASAMGKDSFSMFFMAPVLCSLLLLLILWPKFWEKFSNSADK
ncbi:hypothetical protein [Candidatus Harpocratesius sp.]